MPTHTRPKVYDLWCQHRYSFGDFVVATYHNYEDAEREATRRNGEEELFIYWVESDDGAATTDSDMDGDTYPGYDTEECVGAGDFLQPCV